MARIPPATREVLDPHGQEIYDRLAGPRHGLSGMYQVLMHHPDLAAHVGDLGGFFRFGSTLPGDIRELAIMATARSLGTPFMWEKHVPFAEAEQLSSASVEAVRTGDPLTADIPLAHKAVWELARHIAAQEVVPPDLQALLEGEFGTQGLVEMVAVCGFYRFIATIAVSFDVPLPDAGPQPF
ncbi:carboxymuconolactone decarboxylase family protein [Ornithinimicrobium sediminis]|uniref:carboxymuconolactone decarboxylase family protein n=1 Tax=Ornithinimicrobium sediminis TaxID=2904603 RepID=UPI001E5BA508|nr:hypothetical protein [Ornithinimicrobium sediminis]MCE0485362.1 hypothetical protein [Ornithinimicrobium sediminis]